MKSTFSFQTANRLGIASALALLIFCATSSLAQVQLGATASPDRSVRLAWPEVSGRYQLESAATLDQAWEAYATGPQIVGAESVIHVPSVDATRFFRLRLISPDWLSVLSTSPAQGETGAAVTRETIFRLSAPLGPDVILDANRLFAFAGGRKILGRTELSSDRKTATLFYTENLPPDARVEVTFDGTGLFDVLNLPIDLDGDGVSGGAAKLVFETLSTTALPTTGVEGHVFASEKNTDGSNRPLRNVTITVDGMEETLRATTDTNGFFRLLPSPAGRFFVSVDGRTADGSVWPGGAYYPFVGKAWEASPGRTNNLAGGSGVVYLPLIQADALQNVNAATETKITFAASVLATNPALAGVEIAVPANSLFADSGGRGGRVGIAPVAPDRLPEPLPPGLNLALVITVQTDGARNFDRPVPVRFPNLPDPVTGIKLGPGAKTVLWSFNHDTGRWEPQGTMTISADGNFAVSDPGVGIRQPGWHGNSPGTGGSGPGPGPGGGDCQDVNSNGICDKDDEKRCEADKLKFQFAAVDAVIGFVKQPDMGVAGTCLNAATTATLQGIRDCSIDTNSCNETIALKFMDFSTDCVLSALPQTKSLKAFKDTVTWIKRVKGLFDAGLAYANLDLCEDTAPTGDKRKEKAFAAAGVMVGGFPTSGNPFLQQYEVEIRLHNLFEAAYGNGKWAEIDPTEWPYSTLIINKIRAATLVGSPEGKTVSAAERAAIMALERPDIIEESDVIALITRAGLLVNNGAVEFDTARIKQEAEALNAILAEVITAGWERIYDGWSRGAALARQTATTGVVLGANLANDLPNYPMPARPLHFALIDQGTGFEQRGRLNSAGRFDGIILRPLAPYMVIYFDSFTLRAGATFFTSAAPGQFSTSGFSETIIPGSQLARPPGVPDSDGDGLSDIGERALGTSVDEADSDGDGISDGAEITNGTNPTDGQALGLGTMATRKTRNVAVDLDTVDDFAIVADSIAGVAVFNIANPLAPVLLTETPAPAGTIKSVAAAAEFVLAAPGMETATGARVYVYRRGNNGTLALISAVATGTLPHGLAAAGRYGYAPSSASGVAGITVIHLNSGAVIRKVNTSGLPLRALAIDGDVLWGLSTERLVSFRIQGDNLTLLSQTLLQNVTIPPLETAPKVFAANGRVYVGEFAGFRVFDASDPSAPVLLHDPVVAQAAIHDFSSNGSGLMIPVTSFAGTNTLAISLYNIATDRATNFLTSFNTPGNTRAVALHRGYAVAADDWMGLAVVNYLPTDRAKNPPTITLRPFLSDGEQGQESEELFYTSTATTDDVQVREVEYYIDGTRVGISGNYPFATTLRAPARTATKTSFRLRGKASDTGGNSTWSTELTIPLLPDRTAPRLISFSPLHNTIAPRGSISRLTATFDSAMDESALRTAWKLIEAGLDGNFVTADDVVISGGAFTYDSIERVASWRFSAPLLSGKYRSLVATTATDLNGNALAAAVSADFTIPVARAVSANPFDKAVFLPGTLNQFEIRFDERLSVPTLNTTSLKVLRSDQSEVPGAMVSAMADASGAILRFPGPLPNGTYRLIFTSGLLDVYGSRLVTNFPVAVTVKGPTYWKSDLNGLWSAASNWSNGVPILNDYVIIDRPTANPIVTLTADATLTDFQSEEAVILENAGSIIVLKRATFNGPLTLRDTAASVEGPRIEVFGEVNLSGGLIAPGEEALFAGVVKIASGASFRGGRSRFLNRLEIRGTTSPNAHSLTLEPGATGLIVENQVQFGGAGSRFIISPSATLELSNSFRTVNHFIHSQGASGAEVHNSGVMFKRGTATNTIQVPLINAGIFRVDEGRTTLNADSQNSGTINVAAGARLDIGNNFRATTSGKITGAGHIQIANGSIVDGSHEFTGVTEIAGGSVAFNAAIRSAGTWLVVGNSSFNGSMTELLGPVRLTGGSLLLNSPGESIVADLRVETASELGGSGLLVYRTPTSFGAPLTIQDALKVRFEAPLTVTTNLRAIETSLIDIAANSALAGGFLTGNIDVREGVTLELTGGSGAVTLRFPIAGNLKKTSATTNNLNSTFGSSLTNRSLIEVLTGTLNHSPSDSLFVQEAGELRVAEGAVFTTGGLRLNGGELTGAGKIQARVEIRGLNLMATVNPSGTLSFTGPGYPSWRIGSRTIIDIGAIIQDRITAEGFLQIVAGTLQIRTEPGFDPAIGQEFTIMSAPARSGMFPQVEGLEIGNGKRYRLVYGSGDVKLVVEAL